MWFGDIFGYGGYGYDDYGVNRSGWSDKSEAALRRERQAIQLFNDFLKRCESATSFPVTEEIVPANTHLTSACYTSFRKAVIAKGCTCKRREATKEERKGATRKGKMYVVSVTVPTHPSKLQEARKEKEAKAAEAAAKKKAREEVKRKKDQEEAQKRREEAEAKRKKDQEEAQKRREEAVAYRAAVKVEYETIMGATAKNSDTNYEKAAVNKKPVKTEDILSYASEVHEGKVATIRADIYKEKRELEQELEIKMNNKKARLVKEAEDELEQHKKTIVAACAGKENRPE